MRCPWKLAVLVFCCSVCLATGRSLLESRERNHTTGVIIISDKANVKIHYGGGRMHKRRKGGTDDADKTAYSLSRGIGPLKNNIVKELSRDKHEYKKGMSPLDSDRKNRVQYGDVIVNNIGKSLSSNLATRRSRFRGRTGSSANFGSPGKPVSRERETKQNKPKYMKSVRPIQGQDELKHGASNRRRYVKSGQLHVSVSNKSKNVVPHQTRNAAQAKKRYSILNSPRKFVPNPTTNGSSKSSRKVVSNQPRNLPKPSRNVPKSPLNVLELSINVPNRSKSVLKPSGNVPKPSINVQKPSINVPSPSINVPNPMENVSKSTRNVTKPLRNVPKSSGNIQKPPRNVPKSLRNALKPPGIAPKSPLNAPKPSMYVPIPSKNVPKPPQNVSKPPRNVPNSSINVLNLPKNKPKPSGNVPKSPLNAPKSSINALNPLKNVPKPTRNVKKSPMNIPKLSMHVPKGVSKPLENVPNPSIKQNLPRNVPELPRNAPKQPLNVPKRPRNKTSYQTQNIKQNQSKNVVQNKTRKTVPTHARNFAPNQFRNRKTNQPRIIPSKSATMLSNQTVNLMLNLKKSRSLNSKLNGSLNMLNQFERLGNKAPSPPKPIKSSRSTSFSGVSPIPSPLIHQKLTGRRKRKLDGRGDTRKDNMFGIKRVGQNKRQPRRRVKGAAQRQFGNTFFDNNRHRKKFYAQTKERYTIDSDEDKYWFSEYFNSNEGIHNSKSSEDVSDIFNTWISSDEVDNSREDKNIFESNENMHVMHRMDKRPFPFHRNLMYTSKPRRKTKLSKNNPNRRWHLSKELDSVELHSEESRQSLDSGSESWWDSESWENSSQMFEETREKRDKNRNEYTHNSLQMIKKAKSRLANAKNGRQRNRGSFNRSKHRNKGGSIKPFLHSRKNVDLLSERKQTRLSANGRKNVRNTQSSNKDKVFDGHGYEYIEIKTPRHKTRQTLNRNQRHGLYSDDYNVDENEYREHDSSLIDSEELDDYIRTYSRKVGERLGKRSNIHENILKSHKHDKRMKNIYKNNYESLERETVDSDIDSLDSIEFDSEEFSHNELMNRHPLTSDSEDNREDRYKRIDPHRRTAYQNYKQSRANKISNLHQKKTYWDSQSSDESDVIRDNHRFPDQSIYDDLFEEYKGDTSSYDSNTREGSWSLLWDADSDSAKYRYRARMLQDDDSVSSKYRYRPRMLHGADSDSSKYRYTERMLQDADSDSSKYNFESNEYENSDEYSRPYSVDQSRHRHKNRHSNLESHEYDYSGEYDMFENDDELHYHRNNKNFGEGSYVSDESDFYSQSDEFYSDEYDDDFSSPRKHNESYHGQTNSGLYDDNDGGFSLDS